MDAIRGLIQSKTKDFLLVKQVFPQIYKIRTNVKCFNIIDRYYTDKLPYMTQGQLRAALPSLERDGAVSRFRHECLPRSLSNNNETLVSTYVQLRCGMVGSE